MTDVQDRYRLVSNGFDAAVKAVTPDKWDAQSPCEQWTARDVVAHVVEGHRGVIADVRGGESETLGADEDPRQAWEKPLGRSTRSPETRRRWPKRWTGRPARCLPVRSSAAS